MSRAINRLIIGAGFAIPAALLSFVLVGATPSAEYAAAAQTGDCQSCHQEFVDTWRSGDHSKAVTDPVFQEAWEAQGKQTTCLACHATGFDPATGLWDSGSVDCEACHGPIAGQHHRYKQGDQ